MGAIMLLVVALVATVPAPKFVSWSSSPDFTTKGYCDYTIFIQGDVPYYWTANGSRMSNGQQVTGIESAHGLLPYGASASVDVRTFLNERQLYGEPTWRWTHDLRCEDPNN